MYIILKGERNHILNFMKKEKDLSTYEHLTYEVKKRCLELRSWPISSVKKSSIRVTICLAEYVGNSKL